jgi:hypothetical protein
MRLPTHDNDDRRRPQVQLGANLVRQARQEGFA